MNYCDNDIYGVENFEINFEVASTDIIGEKYEALHKRFSNISCT